MGDQSALDFIGAKKARWHKALFTTYALSLTFFESYVLPALRRTGCSEITVYVDADGYQMSHMERHARFVGQEYKLVPVVRSGGIFHPKLIYLVGDQADLLLVGSGNLTLGGHGRNLEVLEVLRSEKDGAAFHDFAGIASAIAQDKPNQIPDVRPLQFFSSRAGEVARNAEKGVVRLLHSMAKPIGDQLIEQAKGEKWRELLVLSPFHSTDAGPVNRLADKLSVGRVLVGVPSRAGETTSFPVGKAKKWKLPVEYVAPESDDPERRLHAKWIELRGATTWALTGSVNATHQSLFTTDNVEVAALRVLDGPSKKLWKRTDPPPFQADEFKEEGGPERASLFIEVDRSGSLAGQLLGLKDCRGGWNGVLQSGNREPERASVTVDEDGKFIWPAKSSRSISKDSTTHLALRRNGVEATGWVSFEALLKLPPASRLAIGALGRLIANSAFPDDIPLLLTFLSQHLHKLNIAEPSVSGRGAASAVTPESDEAVSLEELRATADQQMSNLMDAMQPGDGSSSRDWRMIRLVARLLAGRPEAGDAVLAETVEDFEPDDDDEGGDGAPAKPDSDRQQQESASALSVFDEAVRSGLEGSKQPERIAHLLTIWCSVTLDMHLKRFGNLGRAQAFADDWVSRVAWTEKPMRAQLDQPFFGLVAALALLVEKNQVDTLNRQRPLTLQRLHQQLEEYCRQPVDKDVAVKAAGEWLSLDVGHQLVGGDVEGALQALSKALGTPTIRGALAACVAGEALSPSVRESLIGDRWRTLLERIGEAGLRKAKRINHRVEDSCPGCGLQLQPGSLSTLAANRFIECPNCQRVMVSLEC